MRLQTKILILLMLIILTIDPYTEYFDSQPTKCFSCEKQLGNQKNNYISGPTKCFSCEKELAKINPRYANYAQPTKCFSCE